MNRISRVSLTSALLFISCLWPSAGNAQQSAPSAWTWAADGNAFLGYNYQQRHFADFSAWESQNWLMGTGERPAGNGRLILDAMLSLEPFTVQPLGSPQLFQTGESYQQIPLVNNQHPHDLLMALGATYRYTGAHLTYFVGADLVGAPTLGPTAFMHRESSRDNPQVPLTHHLMDSTHVTPGVLRAGVELGGFTFETSAFRGQEPDEDRLNIDPPRLDSWAARVGWRQGPWSAQFSGGRLHEPEWFEPYNETRLTASFGFDGTVGRRQLSATLGWGQIREDVVLNGVSDGYLLEWDLKASPLTSLYGRSEIAVKQIFGLGYHPRGFVHPHFYSHIDALTIGVVRDIIAVPWIRLGAGADITLYHMSPDLLLYYEGSHSYHFFLRWRPNRNSTGHVH